VPLEPMSEADLLLKPLAVMASPKTLYLEERSLSVKVALLCFEFVLISSFFIGKCLL
jgi:hypothetical protein